MVSDNVVNMVRVRLRVQYSQNQNGRSVYSTFKIFRTKVQLGYSVFVYYNILCIVINCFKPAINDELSMYCRFFVSYRKRKDCGLLSHRCRIQVFVEYMYF